MLQIQKLILQVSKIHFYIVLPFYPRWAAYQALQLNTACKSHKHLFNYILLNAEEACPVNMIGACWHQ